MTFWQALKLAYAHYKSLRTKRTFVYCRFCRTELRRHGQLLDDDGETVTYRCAGCGRILQYNFLGPAIYLLRELPYFTVPARLVATQDHPE